MSTIMTCIACDWDGDTDECDSPSSMIGFDEPDCYICPDCGDFCIPVDDSISCEECKDEGCYKCTDEQWDEWDWKEDQVMQESHLKD